MHADPMPVDKRIEQVVNILWKSVEGRKVSDLASETGTSPATIRRTLKICVKLGVVSRTGPYKGNTTGRPYTLWHLG